MNHYNTGARNAPRPMSLSGGRGFAILPAMQRLVITIDGPAGSGKSAVARQLAKRLGLAFLDTGAMYRGLAAHCLDQGVNPTDQPDQVESAAQQVKMVFDWSADPPRLHIDGCDVTDRLRDEDVTGQVSAVAALPAVRCVLVDQQRHIGEDHPRLVTEGRDQGSVVFPDAQVKFFLDAAPPVRARRRVEQLRQLGREADESDILQGILSRDHKDANRADGPLICPQDAQRIDTSAMTLEQVVDRLASIAGQQISVI